MIGIAGAGPFGTALAHLVASHGRDVLMWTQDADVCQAIASKHKNPRLTGVKLSERVTATSSATEFTERAALIVLAVPSTGVTERLQALAGSLSGRHQVVHAVGALAHPSAQRVSELVRAKTAVRRVGVIAGPAMPKDLLEGRFASMVVASPFDEVVRETRNALAVPPKLRLYTSRDLVGVELSSALASAYTVALGIADALGTGPGARAVLVTRAIAEGNRLIAAAGAEPTTFAGLSGLGNLLVRSSADARGRAPSFDLGRRLGKKERIEDPENATEGARATGTGIHLAKQLGVRVPVLEAVHAVLTGRMSAQEAAQRAADTVADTE